MKESPSAMRRELGRLMAQARKERGWYQSEVAEKLGIAQPTYNHYENGARGMDLCMLIKVLELYNIDFEAFRKKYKDE